MYQQQQQLFFRTASGVVALLVREQLFLQLATEWIAEEWVHNAARTTVVDSAFTVR